MVIHNFLGLLKWCPWQPKSCAMSTISCTRMTSQKFLHSGILSVILPDFTLAQICILNEVGNVSNLSNGPVTWRGRSLLDLGEVQKFWKNQNPLIPWPKG